MKSKLRKLLENTGDMALKRRAKKIIMGLDIKPKERILDIGCGDGYYLHLLSYIEPSLRLMGTDFDPSGLKKARKNLRKNIKLFSGDLMKGLPFKSNTFDKAVMSEVAEHLPNDLKGLKEVNRVLKRNGVLCLTVPNANYPLFWDPINRALEWSIGEHIKTGFFAGLWNQHIRLYKRGQIVKVVQKAGFRVEESKSLTFWSLPFNHYIVNLVARRLASGGWSKNTQSSLSKYTIKPKRNLILNFAFKFVNTLDKLNDMYQPQDRGVSVFVKAVKL